MPTRGLSNHQPVFSRISMSQPVFIAGMLKTENLGEEIFSNNHDSHALQSPLEGDLDENGDTENEIAMEVPYYDPRSWVWKAKPSVTFAAVIDELLKEYRYFLEEKSASYQNARATTKKGGLVSKKHDYTSLLNPAGAGELGINTIEGLRLFIYVILSPSGVLRPLSITNEKVDKRKGLLSYVPERCRF